MLLGACNEWLSLFCLGNICANADKAHAIRGSHVNVFQACDAWDAEHAELCFPEDLGGRFAVGFIGFGRFALAGFSGVQADAMANLDKPEANTFQSLGNDCRISRCKAEVNRVTTIPQRTFKHLQFVIICMLSVAIL